MSPRRKKAAPGPPLSESTFAESAVVDGSAPEGGSGGDAPDCAMRMPEATSMLWPVDIGGGEPRAMTLETLRQVAMPGGEVPLMPGELFFGGAPARLTTLLGACVTVTAWHPVARAGGLCHFLHPRQPRASDRADGRYGEEALALLVDAIASAGLGLGDFQFKLFGGGGVLGAAEGPSSMDIGGRNLACARAWAASHGLRFIAEDVGGDHYRRLSLDLDTGVATIWRSASVSLAWAGLSDREDL
jgi:chemotaxis protein CheD